MKNFSKDNIKKYLEPLKNVSLSDSERDEMREYLSEYMEWKPARNAMKATDSPRSSVTSVFEGMLQKLAGARMLVFRSAVVGVFMLTLGSGATLAVAEDALPGDFLYPLKTDVTEGIMQLFAVTPEAEARTQSQIVERRIQEVEKLALSGGLEPNIKENLHTRLVTHSQATTELINHLRDSGNQELALAVANDFESNLRAHAQVLDDLGKSTSSISDSDLPNTQENETSMISSVPVRTDDDSSESATSSDLSEIAEVTGVDESELGDFISHIYTVADQLASVREAHSAGMIVDLNNLRLELQQAAQSLETSEDLLAERESQLRTSVEEQIENNLRTSAQQISNSIKLLEEGNIRAAQGEISNSLRLSEQVRLVIEIHSTLTADEKEDDDQDTIAQNEENTSTDPTSTPEGESDVTTVQINTTTDDESADNQENSSSTTPTSSQQVAEEASSTESIDDNETESATSSEESEATTTNTTTASESEESDSEEDDQETNRHPVPVRGDESDQEDNRTLREIVSSTTKDVSTYLSNMSDESNEGTESEDDSGNATSSDEDEDSDTLPNLPIR